MTRHTDDQLRGLYKEASTSTHNPEDLSAWAEAVQAVEKMEKDQPDLRDHGVVSERLTDLFLAQLGKLGKRARYDRDGYREKVTKLVLLFDKPLLAGEVLGAMLENLDDPTEGLEDAIRMAEVAMGAKFVQLPLEEAQEEDFQRFMKLSAALGDHYEESSARKAFARNLKEAEELRTTGIKGRELIEHVSKKFMQNVQDRGLVARDEVWYRDTIAFTMRLHNAPHLAAVTLIQIAQKYPDPTATLNEIREYASRSTSS